MRFGIDGFTLLTGGLRIYLPLKILQLRPGLNSQTCVKEYHWSH